MTSDTPRTDALKVDLSRDTFAVFIEMREHARQLERDLAAANEQIGELERDGEVKDGLIGMQHTQLVAAQQCIEKAESALRECIQHADNMFASITKTGVDVNRTASAYREWRANR